MSSNRVLVAFASSTSDLLPTLLEKLKEIGPGLPLYVVSEYQPPEGEWILYHPHRSVEQNLARFRDILKDKQIVYSAIVLQPRQPYWKLRWLGFRLTPLRLLIFNENLDHYRLHPRSLPNIARHLRWRARNLYEWETNPGGWLYTQVWRLFHPRAYRRPLYWRLARLAGQRAAARKTIAPPQEVGSSGEPGVTVVIPTRNGKHLLETLLPGLTRELAGIPSEIRIIDNGSNDGTAAWLKSNYPSILVEGIGEPLSFSAAVNRGCRAARFSRVCLLNNDMVLESGFFPPLLAAFDRVPDLFCATAQILFPDGVRREETGKAVWTRERHAKDFPIRCDLPVDGEDLSYVLYGSGGCSMYDTAKLRSIGCFGEMFQPAYVEDLDTGYRGWQRGWPTVFVAGARVTHFHRSTTKRYFSQDEIQFSVERNYLRFLARSVSDPHAFQKYWTEALWRLNLIAASEPPPKYAVDAMAEAVKARSWVEPLPPAALRDEEILAIGSGESAVFPGTATADRPTVLIASPYLPFPLSHGGAVRMFNLMREGARDFKQILVAFADDLRSPPRELLDIFDEIVLVRRKGSHLLEMTDRPEVVEEFDSPVFHAVLHQMIRKWRPSLVQLEFTQMAQYTRSCLGLPTLLVEHDITLDLYGQLLQQGETWELRQQYERWVPFEKQAWRDVTRVITMSEKDRTLIEEGHAVTLANGVDLDRFQPSCELPGRNRILFIGSFAHLPNLMAVQFFLREVWPRLADERPVFHVIAGSRHKYFLDLYKDRVPVDLQQPGIEVEDFVADVRPAYRRAMVVVAPLPASAGTNIKVFEAMAMGKPIVATPAGINGVTFTNEEVLVAKTGPEMADAIRRVFQDDALRSRLSRAARDSAERDWSWSRIGQRQSEVYREVMDAARKSRSHSR